MHVLLVSPYHGGSHQAWAEGYRRHSSHEVELLTLPSRFWKWRMHGGAVTLARRFLERQDGGSRSAPEVLLATDMLDLTTFLALVRRHHPTLPAALYMHENQLTYPLPPDPNTGSMRRQHGERDLHYAFINYASMLAADRVYFNSQYHRESLFEALPRFLGRFPEYNERRTIPSLREKASVLPVGLEPIAPLEEASGSNAPPSPGNGVTGAPPLILWNQRWEYDKNPGAFFDALYQISEEGIPFRLALCGERFSHSPGVFEEAIKKLQAHLVHVGYADVDRYQQLLWAADIVISTAHHEFFGISILEAISCETFPILPRRLSYPELIDSAYHDCCLYEAAEGLLRRLRWALRNGPAAARIAAELAPAVAQFSWHSLAARYDAVLAALCESR